MEALLALVAYRKPLDLLGQLVLVQVPVGRLLRAPAAQPTVRVVQVGAWGQVHPAYLQVDPEIWVAAPQVVLLQAPGVLALAVRENHVVP